METAAEWGRVLGERLAALGMPGLLIGLACWLALMVAFLRFILWLIGGWIAELERSQAAGRLPNLWRSYRGRAMIAFCLAGLATANAADVPFAPVPDALISLFLLALVLTGVDALMEHYTGAGLTENLRRLSEDSEDGEL